MSDSLQIGRQVVRLGSSPASSSGRGTVPTSAGLRVETTGVGDSARLDRFGRSASEREPEGLQGPFANALVPPGIGGDHHPGWGDVPQAFPQPCDMGPDEAPVCAREASMDSHPGEVYTPAEMIEAARGESLESVLLDKLSEYVGATVGSLDDLGKALEFTSRFVTASSTGGTGFDGDPWSFERAQFVLGWAVSAPGLEVYFQADDVFDLSVEDRANLENTTLCSRYVIKPGKLLIRISGTEEHWVKISSAVLGDEGWEPEAGLARFVGCATCRSGQEQPRGAGCDPADTDLPSVLDPPTKDLLPPYYIDPGLGVSREVIDQLLRYDWTGMGAPLQRMLRNLLQGGSAGGGH